MDSKQMSQVTTGLVIALVGLIFLAGQLGTGFDIGRLWPLFPLVIGLTQFAKVDAHGKRGNGTWWVFVGVLFLLNNYRILRIGDSWPLFIVAAGVAMIYGSWRDHRHDRNSELGSGQPRNGSAL